MTQKWSKLTLLTTMKMTQKVTKMTHKQQYQHKKDPKKTQKDTLIFPQRTYWMVWPAAMTQIPVQIIISPR